MLLDPSGSFGEWVRRHDINGKDSRSQVKGRQQTSFFRHGKRHIEPSTTPRLHSDSLTLHGLPSLAYDEDAWQHMLLGPQADWRLAYLSAL